MKIGRLGSCPLARPLASGRFGLTGDPVLLPGSMGDASWVLAGSGSDRALQSASHGAGRALARGRAAARKGAASEIDKRGLNVVTPVDIRALEARGRSDIARELRVRLAEEAPSAYKSVEPALRSLEQSGAARRVARLRPLVTIKDA